MEAYEYVIKNENNETVKGLMWADSEQEVGTRLKRDGYKIYKITLQVNKKKHKWNHTMVVDVTYQLGLYGGHYSYSVMGSEGFYIQPSMNRLKEVKPYRKHCVVKAALL